MLCKGKISSVMSGGSFATVTPYNGGIVTPGLAVPVSLRGVLAVGDPVIYAIFPDNTGIILQKADGTGNGSEGVTVQRKILLKDTTTGSMYCVYVSDGALMMETTEEEGDATYFLIDRTTGESYSLYVNNGKLTMEKVGED